MQAHIQMHVAVFEELLQALLGKQRDVGDQRGANAQFLAQSNVIEKFFIQERFAQHIEHDRYARRKVARRTNQLDACSSLTWLFFRTRSSDGQNVQCMLQWEVTSSISSLASVI